MVVFVSFSIIISGIVGFILLEQDEMENYFVATFALGLSYFIGYFMESVNSIFEAKRMEDDLKKCNDNAEKNISLQSHCLI